MNTDEFRPARQPANEANRLAAVKRTGLMDSPNIARFDIYTQLFRHIAGVPVSYTGLLDETRQYFLSENFTGCMTGAREVGRSETICQHALLDTKPYIVPDMRVDPVFKAHPLITGDPHWVFWAGFPIVTREGYVLGTICAVDFVPRALSESQVDLLKGIAAELALSIQMQTDQQELVAIKAEGVLTALQAEGLSTVETARGFLNLCMDRTVSATIAADLIRLGLAAEADGTVTLSAKGRALKTGQGLGPAAYKAAASPLKNTELLDAMFEMLDKGAGLMYSKVYSLKFLTLDEAKMGVSFLSENIGGAISDSNIASLSILLDKTGRVTVTVRFDSIEEMARFEKDKEPALERLRKFFVLSRYSEMSAVAVYVFDREAGTLS